MSENKHETPSQAIDKTAFIERMEKIFARTKTFGDELIDTYKNDPESFPEKLDEAADIIAADDPDYQELLGRLKAERTHGRDDPELVGQIRERYARIKEIIVSDLELPTEAHLDGIARAKAHVSERLATSEIEAKTPQEILVALDIRHPHEEGETHKDIYTFPYDLVPESTVDKWKTYLASVCKHVKMARNVAEVGHEAVVDADRARQYAHNKVTSELHDILGLEGNNGWTWQDTRNLLGKIRDSELSTEDAISGNSADELIKANTNPINIAQLLSHTFHH